MRKIEIAEVMPGPTEQIVVIGQNGSGKSTWIRQVVEFYYGTRQAIIIDEKHDDVWDGLGTIVKAARRLPHYPAKRHPVLVYRPDRKESLDYVLKDNILEWVYTRGHTILVVDESSRLTETPLNIRVGLNDICMRARKRDVLRIFGMQRGSGVPRLIISESRRFYVKRVVDKRDRELMASYAGPSVKLKIPDRYGMRYVDTATDETLYIPHPPH